MVRFLALAIALTACPPASSEKTEKNRLGSCVKVGQSCEFSPGKLGTCVLKDDCEGAACWTCQSQH